MNGERILITGASGFLGSTVASSLANVDYRVREMWRRPTTTSRGEIAVVPDILDRRAVRAALVGVDAVVHLAAHVHDMAPTTESAREYRRINVEGTRLLLEHASAEGVRKFVFFSSVKAVGEGNQLAWTEETVPHPRDEYGRSKLEAESLVLEAGERARVATTVLRLPLAYGPRMKGNMLRLFDAVSRGIPLPFRGIDNRRSMVYSENVAEAVRCCLGAASAAGHVFFVSDGVDLSTPALLQEIGVALRKKPRVFGLPRALLKGAAAIGDIVSGPGRAFPINSEVLQRVFGSLTLDISKLQRTTGYVPPFTPAQGLRQTALWYVNREHARSVEPR